MLRGVLVLLAVVCTGAFAQDYRGAFRSMIFGAEFNMGDEVVGVKVELRFPTIAFGDPSCTGRAQSLLGEVELTQLEWVRERFPEEHSLSLVLNEDCLTFVDLDRGEAHEVIASIVTNMADLGIGGQLVGGRGESGYRSVGNSELNDVMYESFALLDPATFEFLYSGYLVFQYDPDRRVLHLISHRYDADRRE